MVETPSKAAFEDFAVGDVKLSGPWPMTRDAILDFARDYDPQPFHLDEAAASASILGGLSASGWHTAAVLMRLACDGWLNQSRSFGGNGVDEIRWLKPVRPGDILSARHVVAAVRASRSRPEMGLVSLEGALANQDGALVMTQKNTIMMGRRGQAPRPAPPTDDDAPLAPAPAARPLSGWWEDGEIGQRCELGATTFEFDAIVDFAQRFDPQPFHVDAAAAALSPFGGLIASGWHTAAAYMRRFIDAKQAYDAAARAAGLAIPELGPSPGVRDLRWPRPVRPGDRVSYSLEAISRRPVSRPGWGLVESRGCGHNQRGELVFELTGAVFCPLRDPPLAAPH